jgi:hypothetical protein
MYFAKEPSMARFSILVILSILSAISQADTPITPIEYAQDWEGDETEVLSGWNGYINAFEGDCATYLFGYSYNALGTSVAVVVPGADSQVLNTYNDYDGTAWGEGDVNCLEANIYREVTIAAENVGDYSFYFVAEPPELVGNKTNGFIKVLDLPDYSLIAQETVATTSGGERTISFTVDESMVGELLQFGFYTISLRDEPSGMYYDNLVFGAASSGGTGNGGTAEAASTTFNLLLETIDAGRRGTPVDKSGVPPAN